MAPSESGNRRWTTLSSTRRFSLACTAAVGALVIAAPTGASAQPIAGCPSSWSETSAGGFTGGLWLVSEANEQIAAAGVDLGTDDRNGDGYICIRFIENFPPERFFPAFVFTDNNVRAAD
jgi:hypothetical protein